MRYHFFISHFQVEASGHVGTLFHLLEARGAHCWRDMTANNLTTEGMRQGVKDSDVLLVFLTNSTLSRRFCLLEIQWAIEFGKPIMFVVEKENVRCPFDSLEPLFLNADTYTRTHQMYFPFDIERWRRDECTRAANDRWTKGWLQCRYDDCQDEIKALVEEHSAKSKMIPYRRG